MDGQNAGNANYASQGADAPPEANSVQLNQTSTPQSQLESTLNIQVSENVASSNDLPIIPEVLSAEAEQDVPETHGPVSNDTRSSESEPFRESFGRFGREEVGTNAEESAASQKQPEKNPNEISLEEAKLSESEVKNLTVEDIRISRLEMSTQQFNNIVKTRIGAKFNQQRLEEDKRALLQTNQFIDVAVSISWSPETPDKVIVNFDLTPRRLMRYVKVVGNRAISKHDILEELGIRAGESRMDPYE
ncbi:MAG: POTRA domain-containing protein, partial [Thermoguttaceae bacterium]